MRSRVVTFFVLVGVVAGCFVPVRAGASPSNKADSPVQHCLARTSPPGGGVEMRIVGLACYREFAAVLTAVGAPQDIRDRVSYPSQLTESDMTRLAPGSDETTALSIIGIHFDGPGFTGSSFSVSGSDCFGGYLNVSAAWNNRVTSTANGCPTIRHYDGYNLVGTNESTTGVGGNLSYMDNRTSSIQYT